MSLRIQQHGDDVLIAVKAVPGSSRDAIAGVLGDRLKVKVAAPPEGGKANKAICRLLADALELRPADIGIESGTSSAEKIVRIQNTTADRIRAALSQ